MKTVLFVVMFFYTLSVFAEGKLARIKDLDGYSSVRGGEGYDFPIVAIFDRDDFFYCETTNTEWMKVTAIKQQNGEPIEGFIHRSKVQLIETLAPVAKKELIAGVFSKYIEMDHTVSEACKSNNNRLCDEARHDLETHCELKYSPILNVFSDYFCATKDTLVLHLFIETLRSDSVPETKMPSLAMGNCYACSPDIVLKQVAAVKDGGQRATVYAVIKSGLFARYNVDENKYPVSKRFYFLKNKLEAEIKKNY